MRLAELPAIQHVLISHCHYDHLDGPAIRMLVRSYPGVHFWLPEGLSGWFHRRGIRNCTELAWGESAQLSDAVSVHCVPAQHGSARTLFDRNRTHWCGWVLESAERSVYFAGDTGYAPIFREIGERFGGFDLAMIPIGWTRRKLCKCMWMCARGSRLPATGVRFGSRTSRLASPRCCWHRN
jgi:L-ascorbate metabolism protein UlaG (beta-lactamase superfamily)